MELTLLAVGKLRPALREVCDDYLRRLRRFVPVREHEVRESGRASTPDEQCLREGERLIAALSPRQRMILLERAASPWSSEQLARHLDRWRLSGRDHAVIIGGANGVSAAVRARADQEWSLGSLTLPHELARVIAAEQLYRASTILRGEPYHRGTT